MFILSLHTLRDLERWNSLWVWQNTFVFGNIYSCFRIVYCLQKLNCTSENCFWLWTFLEAHYQLRECSSTDLWYSAIWDFSPSSLAYIFYSVEILLHLLMHWETFVCDLPKSLNTNHTGQIWADWSKNRVLACVCRRRKPACPTLWQTVRWRVLTSLERSSWQSAF